MLLWSKVLLPRYEKNNFYEPSLSFPGLIVEFISIPVSSAFGSAVAFTILASEIKNFLGLEYKSNLFTENIEQFIEHAHEVEYGDVSLGIVTIVTLVLLGVSILIREENFDTWSDSFSNITESERPTDLKNMETSVHNETYSLVCGNEQKCDHTISSLCSDILFQDLS